MLEAVMIYRIKIPNLNNNVSLAVRDLHQNAPCHFVVVVLREQLTGARAAK
jgi:hypothetical protein